jgi:hypothetical protein
LAAIWILIFAVNFSVRDKSPGIAEKSAPPSPEVIVELKKAAIAFAELMGSRGTPDADRPEIFLPKPRSERGDFDDVKIAGTREDARIKPEQNERLATSAPTKKIYGRKTEKYLEKIVDGAAVFCWHGWLCLRPSLFFGS